MNLKNRISFNEHVLGFLFIGAIYLLIIQFTFSIRAFLNAFGILTFLLPIIFLYVFGLIGFYLFKTKKKY